MQAKKNINKIATPFHADPQKMKLLSILNKQVELLAEEGQADLFRLFDSLESHSICHQRRSQAYRLSTVLRE